MNQSARLSSSPFDLDHSLNITEMGSIRDQLVTEPPKSNLCEDQTSLFHLQCVDFNGDGLSMNFPCLPILTLLPVNFTDPWQRTPAFPVFNAMGQRIATLADGVMTEGVHTVEFDGKNQAPGIYLCTVLAGDNRQVIKMVLKE